MPVKPTPEDSGAIEVMMPRAAAAVKPTPGELFASDVIPLVTLVNRWSETRDRAVAQAITNGDQALATKIGQFRFMDIRPKAASEIEDLGDASRLLGNTKEAMTKKVYRRVGEIVKPTR